MKKRKVATNPNEEIGDYMVSPVLSVSSDTSTQEAAQLMESKHVGSLLIKDGETFVGIITETDLTRKIVAKGLQDKNPKVSDIMTAPLQTIDCHEPIVDANQLMANKRIRHLAVTDNGQVVGMLSVRDLIHYYANPRMRSW
ncbi:MAG: CBS domain-containing protein [Nitrospinota bacterium]|nr:CBS domain-containing protein [Nitrospinota bacterium]